MFPMAVEALDGRHVLLILVSLATREAGFVPGVAAWDARGGRLAIMPAMGGSPVPVEGSRAALRGFDPSVLTRLIVPEYRDAVLALAAGAEACVAALGDQKPVGAAAFPNPFFGLAGNSATGEVHLFQEGNEGEWDDDAMRTDPNYDPRDETEVRPQVTFELAAASRRAIPEFTELTDGFKELGLAYHDMMLFGNRAAIRFDWETPETTVDAVAHWLESVPSVRDVRRHYGGAGHER